MNLEKFTQKAQEAVVSAQKITQEYNQQSIEPIELLLALIQQQEGVVPALVTRVSGSVNGLRDEVIHELQNRPKSLQSA